MVRAWPRAVVVVVEMDLQYVLKLARLSKGLNMASGREGVK